VISASARPTFDAERPEPPFSPTLIEEMLRALGKAARTHQLYLQNNPVYQRALDSARAAFVPLWAQAEEVVLHVTETAFLWEGRAVLEEQDKAPDSLPWLFYKDGLRELRLLKGFERDELVALLRIVQRARKSSPDEDDILTLLWEQDFLFLRYRYVDLALETVAPLEGAAATDQPVDRRVETQAMPPEPTMASRPGIVNIDDFDATLYFLDEHEVEYLRTAVQREYQVDLRTNVLSMLLDLFELQEAPAVREEVIGILESLMLHLLSASQFQSVAFLLRESAAAMERARNVPPELRQRLLQLPDRLSDPAALSQLLQSLDEATEIPPQADLVSLFEQLRPVALATVFAWLGRVGDARLREVLESAAGRLAAQNTTELVRLITSADRAIAVEAVRRSGALRSPAAVGPLGRALQDDDPAMRLAAANALAEIGSPGAMQQLDKMVDDGDRDVRVAASRAIAARAYRPALPRVEGVIKGKRVREADLTEKMAHFEAYGALCGDAGVPLLDELLNGKSMFGRREDAELRACAAMALGRAGTPLALDALRRAQSEKDVVVRNAVNRAMRVAP
jgi:HEAT repeat protein